jgi:hypothetical protein
VLNEFVEMQVVTVEAIQIRPFSWSEHYLGCTALFDKDSG